MDKNTPNDHDSDDQLDLDGVFNEPKQDLDGPEVEEGAESLPFGMSGVTGLLQRLSAGTDGEAWSLRKQRMVARYLLELSNVYWMNHDELAFCQRVAAA